MTLDRRLCTDALVEPIQVPNPTIIFRIEDYEPSRWTVIDRFRSRMQSIGELFEKLGIEIPDDIPGDDLADALDRDRDAPWGFAVGDRVRMTTLGYTGHVIKSEMCRFGEPDRNGPFYDRCRTICPNVAFTTTQRIADDGTIENVTEGIISCPPADLEHID